MVVVFLHFNLRSLILQYLVRSSLQRPSQLRLYHFSKSHTECFKRLHNNNAMNIYVGVHVASENATFLFLIVSLFSFVFYDYSWCFHTHSLSVLKNIGWTAHYLNDPLQGKALCLSYSGLSWGDKVIQFLFFFFCIQFLDTLIKQSWRTNNLSKL